jgi:acyl carrier protein
MVPSAFHLLPRFPLSPNGKVDRRALGELSDPTAPANRGAATPVTDLEERIGQIWMGVLSRDTAGPDENFFDLGGSSIHLAQVHLQLQKLLGREFPITELFAYTTIRALARHFGGEMDARNGMNALQDRARKQREALAARRNSRK